MCNYVLLNQITIWKLNSKENNNENVDNERLIDCVESSSSKIIRLILALFTWNLYLHWCITKEIYIQYFPNRILEKTFQPLHYYSIYSKEKKCFMM